MADDANKQELVRKVSDLVMRKHGGDYRQAFDHYAAKRSGSSGAVDRQELIDLLKDADIGNRVTHGMWADGIMKELDTDKDGKISWREFESIIRR
jgi:Ca2+-binding EF-hand superfamily protein